MAVGSGGEAEAASLAEERVTLGGMSGTSTKGQEEVLKRRRCKQMLVVMVLEWKRKEDVRLGWADLEAVALDAGWSNG